MLSATDQNVIVIWHLIIIHSDWFNSVPLKFLFYIVCLCGYWIFFQSKEYRCSLSKVSLVKYQSKSQVYKESCKKFGKGLKEVKGNEMILEGYITQNTFLRPAWRWGSMWLHGERSYCIIVSWCWQDSSSTSAVLS